MYLSRLQVQRFRTLYDVDMPLKPLTIIVGPHASGKSNLFKALRFLRDVVAGEWQAYDSQIDHLLWYGADEHGNRPQTMTFACEFSTVGQYQVTLHCKDHLCVKDESLDIAQPKGQTPSKSFQRLSNRIEPSVSTQGLRHAALSPRTLALCDVLELPQARAIYRHITGWRCFEVALTGARKAASISQYPEEIPPLAEDGSNLSAFLYALQQVHPDDFNMIAELLSDFFGLPAKLVVEHDAAHGEHSARYFFLETPFAKGRPIPPQNAADGTIRLLAYLALLLGDRSVSLACLEEPAHSLHPKMMLRLADLFRQVAARTTPDSFTPQILVITHNPELMDCFDLSEESDYLQVYLARRDEHGKTQFISATSEMLAPWLERYRLGEAVRRHLM